MLMAGHFVMTILVARESRRYHLDAPLVSLD